MHICEFLFLLLFHIFLKGLIHVPGFCKVRTKARIVEGDAGKVICREADRLKPAAVILGTRGRGLIQRYMTLKPHISYICATFRSSGLLFAWGAYGTGPIGQLCR